MRASPPCPGRWRTRWTPTSSSWIIWRSFRRAAARTELWNGNRERWRNFFSLDKEESVIAWAWQTHAATRAKLEAARADQGNSHLEFVRLENPGAVRRFLQDLRR